MKALLVRNVALVLTGSAFWLLFGLSGFGAWGFFLPLLFIAVLAPALLAAFSVGPWPLRVLVLSLPSSVAGAVVLTSPDSVEGWAGLVGRVILGGMAVVLVVFLVQVAWREHGPTRRSTGRPPATRSSAG